MGTLPFETFFKSNYFKTGREREGTAVTEVGVADTAPEGAWQRVLESLLESSASSAGLTPTYYDDTLLSFKGP